MSVIIMQNEVLRPGFEAGVQGVPREISCGIEETTEESVRVVSRQEVMSLHLTAKG